MYYKSFSEKVYVRSQILERRSIGKYWNNSGVLILPENVIFMFFKKMCYCYPEALSEYWNVKIILSFSTHIVCGT